MHHTAILSLLILLVVVSSGQRNQNPNINSNNNPNNHNNPNPNGPPTPTLTPIRTPSPSPGPKLNPTPTPIPTLVPTQTPTTLNPTPMGSNSQINPNFPLNGPTLNNPNNFPNPNIPTPTPTPTPLPFMAAWGSNRFGQIGDGTQIQRNISVAVITTALIGYKMTDVACGGIHSLSLSSDGFVFAWGDNSVGQLGDGSGSSQLSPVAVDMSSTLSALKGITVTAISAGYGYSLALSSTGKVYAWGANDYGQLGDGSNTIIKNIPIAVNMSGVLNGKTVTAISTGNSHSLALSSGKVYAWGNNMVGQLGDGTTTNSNVPVAVDTSGVLSGITIDAISAGAYHSLALSSSGKVYSWGSNYVGQLGDNFESFPISSIPIAVDTSVLSALNGKTVSKISGGFDHSLAISGGLVYSWGSNDGGQLGEGTLMTHGSPVAVSTSGGSVLSGKSIVSITGSLFFSLALSSDGFVISWGANSLGELGDNSGSDHRNIPVFVSTNTSSDLNGKSVFAIDTGSSSEIGLVIINM